MSLTAPLDVNRIVQVDELLVELESNAERLAGLNRELGQLLSAEKSAKVMAFHDNDHLRTDKQRESVGSVQSLNITTDIFKVRSDIAAHECRRTYLITAIQARTGG